MERIGPFRIDQELGRGGMGMVYLAHDEDLHRQVAVKVLTEDVGSDLHDRFLREARAAAAIRHPNVATIYQVGTTDDGLPFIAMEYCSGRTLLDVIQAETIEGGRFLHLAIQVAAGLDAAHRNGILHRDIKSTNIMVEDDDTVKILDFGLARPFDADTGSRTGSDASTVGRFLGTLPYLSPEQAQGRPSGTRSDLFSAGVVLYELATGHLPFRSDNPLELLTKIRSEEPEPFEPRSPTVPPEVANIISRLLAKRPEDRMQTTSELMLALEHVYERYEATDDTMTPRSVRTARFSRTVRRTRSSAALMTSLAVLIIVSGIAIVYLATTRKGSGFPNDASAPPPLRSVAVLPFSSLGAPASDRFLSIGLADALVTSLQQIRELRIRPTSAVIKYEGIDADATTVGSELEVEGVLQGSFISSEDRVRVSLQLTDVRSGYSMWADTIDGPRSNLLALIDAVSNRTVIALRQRLGGTARAREEPSTSSPESYEDYLRARSLAGSLIRDQHDEMIGLLARAIEIDPDFAAAYAEMAIALSLGAIRGLDDGTYEDHDSVWYARQAVRLQPNLPEAHLALGRALVREPDRFRESARESLAALRLAPDNPDALFTMISYFVSVGELQRAECATRRFVEIDPTSNDARTRGYFSINAVEPEAAIRLSSLATQSETTRLAGYDILALAQLDREDLSAARAATDEARELDPEHYIPKSLEAMLAAARGDRIAAEKAIASFVPESERNHWAALRIAMTWARVGDSARAMAWIRRAVELGNHSWYFLVKHPWLAPLQNDPEYQQILAGVRKDLDDVRDDMLGVYQLICSN